MCLDISTSNFANHETYSMVGNFPNLSLSFDMNDMIHVFLKDKLSAFLWDKCGNNWIFYWKGNCIFGYFGKEKIAGDYQYKKKKGENNKIKKDGKMTVPIHQR